MKIKTSLGFSVAMVSALAITSFRNAPVKVEQNNYHFAATDTSDVRRVKINEQYSLEVPKFMTVSKELNDEASLQYQNTEEELYVIVIDEPKDEFVKVFKKEKGWDDKMTVAENYRRVQVASMKSGIKMKGKPVITATKASDVAVEIVDFSGRVKGVDFPIFYKTGFLECEGFVYMIMTWTLDSKKAFHNQDMEKMIKSFRPEK